MFWNSKKHIKMLPTTLAPVSKNGQFLMDIYQECSAVFLCGCDFDVFFQATIAPHQNVDAIKNRISTT